MTNLELGSKRSSSGSRAMHRVVLGFAALAIVAGGLLLLNALLSGFVPRLGVSSFPTLVSVICVGIVVLECTFFIYRAATYRSLVSALTGIAGLVCLLVIGLIVRELPAAASSAPALLGFLCAILGGLLATPASQAETSASVDRTRQF